MNMSQTSKLQFHCIENKVYKPIFEMAFLRLEIISRNRWDQKSSNFYVYQKLLFISNKMTHYRKFPKYSDTQKICCNHSKIWTMWLYHRVMSPNHAEGMANSVEPDQTAPLEAIWSGSALFAQAYLSENLGSLRYLMNYTGS